VLLGAGTLRRAGDEAGRLGRRVFFVCTPSLAGSRHAAAVRDSLAGSLRAEWTEVAPHVPVNLVDRASALARQHAVDVVVALGGGSAIGLAKAIGHAATPSLPVVAIPTTYAGSEMTPVLGTTDTTLRQKHTVSHWRILPRVAIYDVDVTLELPPAVTAATGMNALAHCIEAVYSTSASPLVAPVAFEGAARISRALPVCVANGSDVAARTEMLVGAFLAGFSLAYAGMALHHGLCHALGGGLNLAHGTVNAIMLPHVMRYNADAVGPALASVGAAMGIVGDPAAGVADLVARLGLPQRLRDLGVAQSDLGAVAAAAMPSPAVRANPKPISQAQVLEVLRSAW
jgi:maleylacetate reductase